VWSLCGYERNQQSASAGLILIEPLGWIFRFDSSSRPGETDGSYDKFSLYEDFTRCFFRSTLGLSDSVLLLGPVIIPLLVLLSEKTTPLDN
jgi:hypothetical protein